MHLASMLSIAAAASVSVGTTSAIARTPQVAYQRCRHGHLSVAGARGTSLDVTNLRVSWISCKRVAAAVRAGTFEATPAGPLFSIPGFTCGEPVGPPPPGVKPRYYHCSHGRQRFEFLVPGFS